MSKVNFDKLHTVHVYVNLQIINMSDNVIRLFFIIIEYKTEFSNVLHLL